MSADARSRARELARAAALRGDPNGWFEQLYAESAREGFRVGWADLQPNPWLVEWMARQPAPPAGRALVVGCGLGDDAELLAAAGSDVTAFDVAPSAIAECRRRFPRSPVRYEARDVLNAPARWSGAFDLVFEAYTIQVLSGPDRAACIRAIGGFVSPGGSLLVVARSGRPGDPPGDMPWPMTRGEMDGFLVAGLTLAHLREVVESGDEPVLRFVAEFVRLALD